MPDASLLCKLLRDAQHLGKQQLVQTVLWVGALGGSTESPSKRRSIRKDLSSRAQLIRMEGTLSFANEKPRSPFATVWLLQFRLSIMCSTKEMESSRSKHSIAFKSHVILSSKKFAVCFV